ncbi:MoaD/ThiS family protein [Sphingopyxis sp. XHP0097]|uniref:MoaD/ThiS family protein n=1 Tax=Sphingopyxis jiangsuensis TaxID=2871171 RepID=A0ABS7MEK3_9SPHN|nr:MULTISPECIES: MoaD/ThiS family protein [Sphingopyxis]MBY4636511.1 MoaD/ThiS family protein [Sphingopyxis jiangsuensis]
MFQTNVSIELCGRLAEPCGRVLSIGIPNGGLSVPEMVARLVQYYPDLLPALARGRIRACVNETIVPDRSRVRPGDQVALFPPVSGG